MKEAKKCVQRDGRVEGVKREGNKMFCDSDESAFNIIYAEEAVSRMKSEKGYDET